MPNKIDIVNGTYQLIRISGLTADATPKEIDTAVQVLDDYMAELKPTLDLGYIQPLEYGESDPDDYSGLTANMAGPVKKLLAREIVSYFGKDIPPSIQFNAEKGLRNLEHQIVNVKPAQNPATLPIGSGNEWDYRTNKFYSEPDSDDNAEEYYIEEVFQLPIDWSSWLADLYTLVSVTYDADSGIVLADESIIDETSVVTVSFDRKGQFELCIKAENSNGDIKVLRLVYNVNDCRNTDLMP